jgi:putative SOS response-associated peptidase YedK
LDCSLIAFDLRRPGLKGRAGVSLWSATIITHHATWLAGAMNDRTPVILPPDRIDAWLDPQLTDKIAALKLISGIKYELLRSGPSPPRSTRPGAAVPEGPS